MKTICSLLLTAALILSVVVFAVAREGPDKQAVATHQTIAGVPSAVVVRSVPPMTTGFDVIQNLTAAADTSAESRLSTTVGWRTLRADTLRGRTVPAPLIVLLA